MIIIPDVHGRTFWKDAVLQKKEGEKVVFLGDYLDPYPYEWIKDLPMYGYWMTDEDRSKIVKLRKDTIHNFIEIIEYKKAMPDDVVLLIGNHDCGYAVGSNVCDCRTDHENYDRIKTLFDENADLFQLAYETNIKGKHIILSHAGIHKAYADQCFGDECIEGNVVDMFNDAFKTQNYGIMESLGHVSGLRGGWSRYGSIVWADVREWSDDYMGKDTEKQEFDAYQIFGHSQQEKDPVIEDKFACLDCRRAFRMDEEAVLTPITPESVIE